MKKLFVFLILSIFSLHAMNQEQQAESHKTFLSKITQAFEPLLKRLHHSPGLTSSAQTISRQTAAFTSCGDVPVEYVQVLAEMDKIRQAKRDKNYYQPFVYANLNRLRQMTNILIILGVGHQIAFQRSYIYQIFMMMP